MTTATRKAKGRNANAKPADSDRFPKCKSCGKPIDEAPRWTTYGGSGLCDFCEPNREEAPVLAPSRPRALSPSLSPLSTVTPAGIREHDPEAAPPEKGGWQNGSWYATGTLDLRTPEAWGLTIDPEFQARHRQLDDVELQKLRSDIMVRGCLDPLIVWECRGEHGGVETHQPIRYLVDGHNRYRLAYEHRKPVAIVLLEFASRAEVLEWIDAHQVGRRNLSPAERDEILARSYHRELAARKNGAGKNGAAKNGQPLGKAADKVAEETGVSPATVKRAASWAETRDQVAEAAAVPAASLNALSRNQLKAIAELPPAEIKQAFAGGNGAVKKLIERTKHIASKRAARDRKSAAKPDRKAAARIAREAQHQTKGEDDLGPEAETLVRRYVFCLDDELQRPAVRAIMEACRLALIEIEGRHKQRPKSKRKPR